MTGTTVSVQCKDHSTLVKTSYFEKCCSFWPKDTCYKCFSFGYTTEVYIFFKMRTQILQLNILEFGWCHCGCSQTPAFLIWKFKSDRPPKTICCFEHADITAVPRHASLWNNVLLYAYEYVYSYAYTCFGNVMWKLGACFGTLLKLRGSITAFNTLVLSKTVAAGWKRIFVKVHVTCQFECAFMKILGDDVSFANR